jgi:hypothetical protein
MEIWLEILAELASDFKYLNWWMPSLDFQEEAEVRYQKGRWPAQAALAVKQHCMPLIWEKLIELERVVEQLVTKIMLILLLCHWTVNSWDAQIFVNSRHVRDAPLVNLLVGQQVNYRSDARIINLFYVLVTRWIVANVNVSVANLVNFEIRKKEVAIVMLKSPIHDIVLDFETASERSTLVYWLWKLVQAGIKVFDLFAFNTA